MLGLVAKFVVQFDAKPVLRAAKTAKYRNLGHAGASIRKDAMASIEPGEGPSEPGEPPHTHPRGGRGRGRLPRSIRYAREGADRVVIGPRASVIGQAMVAHEFGGTHRGAAYSKRPVMGPALMRALPRIGSQWKGSIVS